MNLYGLKKRLVKINHDLTRLREVLEKGKKNYTLKLNIKKLEEKADKIRREIKKKSQIYDKRKRRREI